MPVVDESVLSVLTEARSYRWWLAPQIAESAWPNRGTGPATAALHSGAVIPSFDNRFQPGNFRPLDTSAGNSHIELGCLLNKSGQTLAFSEICAVVSV